MRPLRSRCGSTLTPDQGSVEESVKADQIIPVLVLSEQELESGPERLADILEYYVENDDVCSDEFTGILVVKPSRSEATWTNITVNKSVLPTYHLKVDLEAQKNAASLTSGPYFLSGPNLHQAWRLYPDNLDAFTVGVIPEALQDPSR